MVDADIDALCRACTDIGAHVPLWTQGAGGNVSIKDDARMVIKASGQRLAAVLGPASYAALPLQPLRQRLLDLAHAGSHSPAAETAYATALTQLCAPEYGRPSMEAGMHALLPGRCVAHFHALSAVLMGHHAMVQPGTVEAFLAAQGVVAAFVPATLPGLQLCCALLPVAQAQVIILGNHGVVLQGEASAPLLALWRRLEAAFCAAFDYPELALYLAAAAAPPRHFGAPMRLYFPDTAVFADRLMGLLTAHVPPEGGAAQLALAPHAWQADRNTAELWWATTLLYRLCPTLAELPPSQAQSVAGLPTEVWRRRKVDPSATSQH